MNEGWNRLKILPDKKLRTKANHGPRSNTINSPCLTDIRQSKALSNYLSPNEAHTHNNKNCMHLNIEYFTDDEAPSGTSTTIHYKKKTTPVNRVGDKHWGGD